MTTNRGDMPVIEVMGISKQYPGVQALDSVYLACRPGEIVALTGENGSGKSTLAKVIMGAVQPDTGSIAIDGEPARLVKPADALRHGIVGVSQELTLATSLSVMENLLLGRLETRGGKIDWPANRRLAAAALEMIGADIPLDARVDDLSVEQQQLIEIGRAVSRKPRLLVIDEATSSLSEKAAENFLDTLAQLAADGTSILMVTHRMDEIYRLCNSAVVLRDGVRVAEVPIPETSSEELVRHMIGRVFVGRTDQRTQNYGDAVLAVEGVATPDGTLAPISFEVRAGEILGVAGLMGSGKSEVARALAGAMPRVGKVECLGQSVPAGSPKRALQSGIAYVPDDRKRDALFLGLSVAHNALIGVIKSLKHPAGWIDRRKEKSELDQAIVNFDIRAPSNDVSVNTLSGGNQQKSVLARAFGRRPAVLVLNEPTRGIDVAAKAEIYQLIDRAADEGTAIVVVSSEHSELIRLCGRVIVMYGGHLVATLEGDDLDEHEVGEISVTGVSTKQRRVAASS